MNLNIARQIRTKQLAALALIGLCFTQLPARGGQAGREQIELLSVGWGMTPGQKTRITVVNDIRQGGSGVGDGPLNWQVSALDADGNQIFQSPELVVPVGGFRYVDVQPSDLPMPSETLTGRKQVRWKVILFVRETQLDPPLVSAELIDSSGATTLGHSIGLRHEHTRPE
jgi:hypothetical protein